MRNGITHSYIFVAVLCLNALPIASAQSDKSITIHQEIEFNASPQQLYEALLDSKKFTELSGRPAEINREVGGAFSLSRVTSSAAISSSFRISASFKPGAL
jgi:hypothetical protein